MISTVRRRSSSRLHDVLWASAERVMVALILRAIASVITEAFIASTMDQALGAASAEQWARLERIFEAERKRRQVGPEGGTP